MDKAHIVSAFDEGLDKIESLIIQMGGRAERQIVDASEALHNRDVARAEQVIASDKAIDQLQEQVDADIISLIALRQPKAQDLRAVIGALKVSANLERVGDYAKNMAKRTSVISNSPQIGSVTSTLNRIAGLVQSMLADVLDAYVKRDVDLANDVRARDEEVDHMNNSLFRELLTHMMENPGSITPCMHLLFISKNLERIGDHITGISEQVHFMVVGEYPADERTKVDVTSQTSADMNN
jgi:phosphate transport system protein